MTREELIEVIRNQLWRQMFARDEDAETIEDQKLAWTEDWERLLPKAQGILLAIEAAGVRLVPVDPDDNQLAAGMESDSIAHPWEALGVYRQMVSFSPYAPKETL